MPETNEAPEILNSQTKDQGRNGAQIDAPPLSSDPLLAATSLEDSGQIKRPRDARLLHIILSSLGVQAYQERVPLQLMDFAYRYTSSVLQDALHLTSEAYGSSGTGARGAAVNDLGTVTLQALRLAVASRQQFQFQPNLPKEHFQELAAEKNRIALPTVGKNTQIRLPPERYCLTGVGFNLKEHWEDEIALGGAGEAESSVHNTTAEQTNGTEGEDVTMQGIERAGKSNEPEDADMTES